MTKEDQENFNLLTKYDELNKAILNIDLQQYIVLSIKFFIESTKYKINNIQTSEDLLKVKKEINEDIKILNKDVIFNSEIGKGKKEELFKEILTNFERNINYLTNTIFDNSTLSSIVDDFDKLILETVNFLNKYNKVDDVEFLYKKFDWNENKPFSLLNLYEKIIGENTETVTLKDVLQNISRLYKKELDMLNQEKNNNNNDILKIKKDLENNINIIENSLEIKNMNFTEIKELILTTFKNLFEKYKIRFLASNGIKIKKNRLFNICKEFCINPSTMHKFIHLYQLIQEKSENISYDNVSNQIQMLPEIKKEVCSGSYDIYYNNIANIIKNFYNKNIEIFEGEIKKKYRKLYIVCDK